jgi:hypothetical protein
VHSARTRKPGAPLRCIGLAAGAAVVTTGDVPPKLASVLVAAAVLVLAGCGSSPSATTTNSSTPTPTPSQTASPVPTASPSASVSTGTWTTVTLQGSPPVTVSIPSGWVPQAVVGDGSSVTIDGPGGAIIGFGHPTGGSWTTTSCDQQAPKEVPEYVASGSEPITIDGLPTTEYSVPDMTLISYSAGTYLTDGSCLWATATPGNEMLDHTLVDKVFSSARYGS